MKLTKHSNNSLLFLSFWKNCMQLLLLVGVLVNSFGQIYVGKNTTVFIQEGTVLHISENKTNEQPTAKIYVKENAKVINLSKDSSPEIVYLKSEKQTEKNRETIAQNKPKKNLQPPIVKEDTESENIKDVLSFSEIPKTPSTLFYSGKASKGALVQNISMGTKFFPLKKSYNSIVHPFLLNNDQQIKIASNEFLLSQQANLEEYTTRPPPSQMS